MRISLIQTDLTWENPAENRGQFDLFIQPLADKTDIIVLPEMFTTGFSMNAARFAEPMDGPSVKWMQEKAAYTGAAITGSIMCRENDTFFNRLLWVTPEGNVQWYNKGHLFSMAGEHEVYTPGTSPVTVQWKHWNIRLQVCYDLRFPEWARNRPPQPYDLLLYVANWPARRAYHWSSLLIARAIENLAYVAGVNIVGTDGNGLSYTGDTAVIDYAGTEIYRAPAGMADTKTVLLSREALSDYRARFPFLNDQI